jgi:hypothetical protein
MLFTDVEVQKRKYDDMRPPILPPPPLDSGSDSAKDAVQ